MSSGTRRAAVTAVAASLVIAASLALSTAAMAADSPDGIGLTVTVTAPPTSPTPTSTSNPGGSGGPGTVVTPETPTGTSTPRPDEVDLGGILYVSGLSSEGRATVNPGATQAHLQFTVRNVSSTVITAKAKFSVAGPFGNQLGTTETVQIYKLRPDETRVVQTTIRDVGQWAFYRGQVTLTPPKEVEGVKLSPLTREQNFVIVPWFAGSFVVLGLAAFAIFWVLRFSSLAGVMIPRGSTA